MFLETFKTDGLSIYTYFMGCGDEAAIIDPTRDIEPILDRLEAKNVTLKYIFETHIHADFISGARQLANATGANVMASGEGLKGEMTSYGYESISTISNDDVFHIGQIELKAIHTPGHTPEHMSYLLTDHNRSSKPVMMFTGDFLFVGSIGRPDLLGGTSVKPLASALYDTIYEGPVTKLPDHLLVLPGHGSGSACGKAIGDVPTTTLGTERLLNEAFRFNGNKDKFIEYILKDQPAAPAYFPMMKKLNREGPAILLNTDLTRLPSYNLSKFKHQVWDKDDNSLRNDFQILDLRKPTSFSGGHIPGSISIWYSNSVATWGGWALNFDDPIFIVHDNEYELRDAVRQLRLVGIDNIEGYLSNGFDSWQTSGYPIERIGTIDAYQLDKALNNDEVKILDVRTPTEFEDDHIQGAIHIEAGYIEQNIDKLDAKTTYAIMCGGGYRASLAASLLKKNGFDNVVNVLGGMSAWNDHKVEEKIEA